MLKQNIKVYCRVRGLTDYDVLRGAVDNCEMEGQQIKIEQKTYNFNQLVKGDQIQMNNEIKEVDQWFITYGGCATGKSTTMFGENGVIFQICGMYLNHFKDQKVSISMIQVEEQKIIDLFTSKEVKLQESKQSFTCTNLTSINIESFDQFSQVLKTGLSKRSTQQVVMNCNASRFPILIKIEFANFSLQFCDMVGYEKTNCGCSPQVLKQVSCNNNALSLIERVVNTKSEKEKLILCNSALLTKVMKNAFRDNADQNWFLCISSSNLQLKDTLRTLNMLKN